MGKPQLLPCPFCGKSDAFVERLDSSSSMVICQGMVDEYSACMARGPVGIQDDDGEQQPGYDAAVRGWNARQGAAAQNAARYEFLRDHAQVDWKLDYQRIEVVFECPSESFDSLDDVVDAARELKSESGE